MKLISKFDKNSTRNKPHENSDFENACNELKNNVDIISRVPCKNAVSACFIKNDFLTEYWSFECCPSCVKNLQLSDV